MMSLARQRGQIIFLMMFLLIPLVLLIGYILNAGAVTAARAKLQNAVDSSVMTESAWVARSLNVMSQNNTAITQSVVVGTAAFALEGPVHFAGQQAGEVAGHYFGRASFLIEKSLVIPQPLGGALALVTAGYYLMLFEELNRHVLVPLKDLHDNLKKAVFDGYCLLGCPDEQAGLARAAYAFGKMNTLIASDGAATIQNAAAAQANYNGVNGVFRRYSGWGWLTEDPNSHRELRIPVVKQSVLEGFAQIKKQILDGTFTLGTIMSGSEHIRNLLNIRSTGEQGTHTSIANIEFDYFSNFDNHGYAKGSGPYVDPNGGQHKVVNRFDDIHKALDTLSEGKVTEDPITKAFLAIGRSPPDCDGLALITNFAFCTMKKMFEIALDVFIKPFTNTQTEIPAHYLKERIDHVWDWATLWRDIPYSAEFDDSASMTIPVIDYRIAAPPRFFWTFAMGLQRGRQPFSAATMDSMLQDFKSQAEAEVSDMLGDVYESSKNECERLGQIELSTVTYPALEARATLPPEDPQYLTVEQVQVKKVQARNQMESRCEAEAVAQRSASQQASNAGQPVNSGSGQMQNTANNPPTAQKQPSQTAAGAKAQSGSKPDWLNYALWRPEWFYQGIVKNSIPFSIGDEIDGFGSTARTLLAFDLLEIDLYAVRQPRLLPELSSAMRNLGATGAIPGDVALKIPTVGPTREDWSIVHLATGKSGAPIFSSGFPGANPSTSVMAQAEVFNAQWYDLYTQHWRAKHTPLSLVSCDDCSSDRERMRELFAGQSGTDVLVNFLKVDGSDKYQNLATH